MTFLAYALLFFFSGFAGHLANADRGNAFGLFLTVALPVAGVYFLGWWALLAFFVGLDRGNAFGLLLTVALPVAGVYFLGWWALLAFFVGLAFGGRVFWELERRLTRTGRALPHPTGS
jgi:hypothetical protein